MPLKPEPLSGYIPVLARVSVEGSDRIGFSSEPEGYPPIFCVPFGLAPDSLPFLGNAYQGAETTFGHIYGEVGYVVVEAVNPCANAVVAYLGRVKVRNMFVGGESGTK